MNEARARYGNKVPQRETSEINMNIVALLVGAISVLFVSFACVTMLRIVTQAIRASRANDTEEEKALVRNLLGAILFTVCMGFAGFWAFTDPATYDVARYSQMSRQEQKRLEFGVLFSGGGLLILAWYALQQRSARRRQRSDEAVARAIDDWKATHKQGGSG